MTAQRTTTADTTSRRAGGPAASTGGSHAAIAVAVLAGAVGKVVFLGWHAPFDKDETVPYGEFLPLRDAWWAVHFFAGAAMALGFIALAVAACLLARRRGAAWATAGAAVMIPGSLLLGAGLAGEGVAFGYAANPAAVPAAQGTDLLAYMFEHAGPYLVGILAGLALVTIGGLLIAVGLIRARSVPLWVPISLIIGTLLLATTPHAITWLATLPATIAAIAIGWHAWRPQRPSTRSHASGPQPARP